ncbi:hypothetical protein Pst134EA_028862 [Puccinia striiformis f. sp. tritici]|uniref:hypothetical protein n=1 Tax=Puccinia striiformis f. sp. tritici TaxID=168172 RepID=UPI0020086800|nr:hypothetical protein Pst134EA_028862 [Puccinia striiformis f. sp. tritici]KAH9446874.1 hypothetical protein Pst134EA_028862 [Puccinia striiformis f. sp. tritici]
MRLTFSSFFLWLPLLLSSPLINGRMFSPFHHPPPISGETKPEFIPMENQIRMKNEIDLEGARPESQPLVVFSAEQRRARSQENLPSSGIEYAHGLHPKANRVLDHLIQEDSGSFWQASIGHFVEALEIQTHRMNLWHFTSAEDQARITKCSELLEEAVDQIEKMFKSRASHLIHTKDPSITEQIAESAKMDKMPFSRGTIAKMDKIFESIDDKLKKNPNGNYRNDHSVPAWDVVKVTQVFQNRFGPIFIDQSLEEFKALDPEMQIAALKNLSKEVDQIKQKFLDLAEASHHVSLREPVRHRLGKSRLGRFPLGNPPPDDLSLHGILE